MSETLHHRARVAALSRSRSEHDPDLIEARRSFHAARLAEHVAKALAEAPPLTNDQRASIARILVGGGA